MDYDSRPETIDHINAVRVQLQRVLHLLAERALYHDSSKLVSPELEIFNEYTPKLKNTTYGSVEYTNYLSEMKVGLDHHYKENRHHPEHYADGINGMTLIDLIEMVCDWIAATKRHADGDIWKSLEINTARFGISHQLRRVLENTVQLLIGPLECGECHQMTGGPA